MTSRFHRYPSATTEDIDSILDRLRAVDAAEMRASGIDRDLVHQFVELSDYDVVVFDRENDDAPVFAFGVLRHGSVAQLWGFGTDEAPAALRSVIRWGLTHWLPDLFERYGIKRVEVRVPSWSVQSIQFLRRLGLRVECPDVYGLSSDGSAMTQLAYTIKEYESDYVLPVESSGRAADRPSGAGRPADQDQRRGAVGC